MMQVSKKIPFEDPNVLFIVRCIYIGSNVLIGAVSLYIQYQINKKKGTLAMPLAATLGWLGHPADAYPPFTNRHDDAQVH